MTQPPDHCFFCDRVRLSSAPAGASDLVFTLHICITDAIDAHIVLGQIDRDVRSSHC